MNVEWLKMLVCPITKAPLRYDAKNQLLIAESVGHAYPVRDGIPVLLAEEVLAWPVQEK